jgi:hypothetical protein
VLSDGSTTQRLSAQGLEPIGDSPTQFAVYLKSDAVKWGKLVKSAGIKPE